MTNNLIDYLQQSPRPHYVREVTSHQLENNVLHLSGIVRFSPEDSVSVLDRSSGKYGPAHVNVGDGLFAVWNLGHIAASYLELPRDRRITDVTVKARSAFDESGNRTVFLPDHDYRIEADFTLEKRVQNKALGTIDARIVDANGHPFYEVTARSIALSER